MTARFRHPLALALVGTAVLVLPACGDDEEQTDTGLDISISVPSPTKPADADSNGKSNVPPAGPASEVPQVSEAEQQRINECVRQAEGDPDKLTACFEIANE